MFTINNQTWHIQFVSANNPILQRSDGSWTVAVTDNTTKTIYIANTVSGSFFNKVLTHEIVHCYCLSYDIEFTLRDEEICADLIATYGYEILQLTDKICKRIKAC